MLQKTNLHLTLWHMNNTKPILTIIINVATTTVDTTAAITARLLLGLTIEIAGELDL